MASIFSRIVAGQVPCFKIYEDELTFAFLDIQPLTQGHTLLIPKREVDQFYELDEAELVAIALASKKIASALQKVSGCVRICSVVAGYEVPHAHLHLVPTWSMSDISFSKPKLKLSGEQMESIASKIRQELAEK
jgi:histidine triad (HIT) family protein